MIKLVKNIKYKKYIFPPINSWLEILNFFNKMSWKIEIWHFMGNKLEKKILIKIFRIFIRLLCNFRFAILDLLNVNTFCLLIEFLIGWKCSKNPKFCWKNLIFMPFSKNVKNKITTIGWKTEKWFKVKKCQKNDQNF